MTDREKEIYLANKSKSVENRRRVCFQDARRLCEATFDKDMFLDITTPLKETALKYVDEWEDNRKNGHSLFFYGGTGIGKTFYGACITNALLENDKRNLYRDLNPLYFFMPSLEWLTSNQRTELLERIRSADFIFLDEFDPGTMPRNAINFYFAFFNTLYERRIPFVITTNASPQSMLEDKQTDDRFVKIYDRIMHQCAKYGFKTSTLCVRKELTKYERENQKAL